MKVLEQLRTIGEILDIYVGNYTNIGSYTNTLNIYKYKEKLEIIEKVPQETLNELFKTIKIIDSYFNIKETIIFKLEIRTHGTKQHGMFFKPYRLKSNKYILRIDLLYVLSDKVLLDIHMYCDFIPLKDIVIDFNNADELTRIKDMKIKITEILKWLKQIWGL